MGKLTIIRDGRVRYTYDKDTNYLKVNEDGKNIYHGQLNPYLRMISIEYVF